MPKLCLELWILAICLLMLLEFLLGELPMKNNLSNFVDYFRRSVNIILVRIIAPIV